MSESILGLDDFIRSYPPVSHHREVRTEHLAESFRGFYGLPPFPTLSDLTLLCDRLGASLERLPSSVPMDGLYFWPKGKPPEIHVRENLRQKRTETTVGHELRELIEVALTRANPNYVGLDTANNDKMNGESDQFASCLLMQAEASKALLGEIGFDLPRFSRRTGRSLSSVVLRLQWLYSATGGESTPHCGIWLFEAPWNDDDVAPSDWESLTARYEAKLCGFSQSRSKGPRAQMARDYFPMKGMNLTDFEFGMEAARARMPKLVYVDGFDLFSDQNYTLIAEPLTAASRSLRLLVVGVRNDSAACFRGWVSRLPLGTSSVGRQR